MVTVGIAVPALKQATSVIPIVFAVDADPVGAGLWAAYVGLGRKAQNEQMFSGLPP
jgi:hypothetical protein